MKKALKDKTHCSLCEKEIGNAEHISILYGANRIFDPRGGRIWIWIKTLFYMATNRFRYPVMYILCDDCIEEIGAFLPENAWKGETTEDEIYSTNPPNDFSEDEYEDNKTDKWLVICYTGPNNEFPLDQRLYLLTDLEIVHLTAYLTQTLLYPTRKAKKYFELREKYFRLMALIDQDLEEDLENEEKTEEAVEQDYE